MNKRRFTLIELVIALALFAMLSLSCMKLLMSTVDSLEVQEKSAKRIVGLVNLDKNAQKMFTNTVPFTWRDEENQRVPHFYGAPDMMRFVHLNRVNDEKDGGLRFVQLYIDNEQKLIAHYQTRPFLNGSEIIEEIAFKSTLAEGVDSLNFQYASVLENQQSSEDIEWLSEWEEDRLDIPLAVRMDVSWQNGRTESFLWRTAGNSYYERMGAWKNGDRLQ